MNKMYKKKEGTLENEWLNTAAYVDYSLNYYCYNNQKWWKKVEPLHTSLPGQLTLCIS